MFDDITPDDLIMAFFPCTYFETMSMMYFSLDTLNNKTKPKYEQVRDAVERLERRTFFHAQLYKLLYVVFFRGLRLIIENPATTPHYLVGTQNFLKPTIIDKNRMERGDEFKKPTAYWFINCKPTDGYTPQNEGGTEAILQDQRLCFFMRGKETGGRS